MSVRGVLQVHSAPPALSPHVEWAVAGVLGVPVNLPWVNQPAAPGMVRAEIEWEAPPGTGGRIASSLTGWDQLRFEVTEEASAACDAMRYSYTPSLGVFSAITTANGDIAVPEGRLRAAMTVAAAAASGVVRRPHMAGPSDGPDLATALHAELALLLGQPWDSELEPFRCAAEGAPVRWLHATG